jgi:hypothetical protein
LFASTKRKLISSSVRAGADSSMRSMRAQSKQLFDGGTGPPCAPSTSRSGRCGSLGRAALRT